MGRYIISYIYLWFLKALQVPGSLTTQLRGLNLGAGVCSIYFISRQLLHYASGTAPRKSFKVSSLSTIDHGALNVCLFPPLFFFYGLYYTDILSAGIILHVYIWFQERSKAKMVLGSLLALSLRQTNIFWVAVYFGGLEVLRTLRRGQQGIIILARSSFSEVVVRSWQTGCLYDPLVSNAYFEGLCLNLLTICLGLIVYF